MITMGTGYTLDYFTVQGLIYSLRLSHSLLAEIMIRSGMDSRI